MLVQGGGAEVCWCKGEGLRCIESMLLYRLVQIFPQDDDAVDLTFDPLDTFRGLVKFVNDMLLFTAAKVRCGMPPMV